MSSSADNAFSGDFGEQWLQVVASGAKLLHGRPLTLDFEKADIEIVLPEVVPGTAYPTVKAQVKTTVSARVTDSGDLVYDLDVSTYDLLRRTDHAVRRVLVVVALPGEDLARVRVTEGGTLLVGRARWVSLEGAEPTSNASTVSVTLPGSQVVDPEGLRGLLLQHGVRTPTPVADVDPWRGGDDDV
ncbi:DUF4365 domain-containing protein [Quadrisphaera setariae]|uniref:DUF4365 domain-containing protein n=1 Tax=Quadrisphaera setariae TaxID=2593304 RepID=A0A5C8ZE74_9ACTN|nr:DUF4365 domain-containing protein [Quadrisphaera setariae]TXR55503.1 DUF4365 domain-containing protein [Quadrisphaera setariae]